MLIIARTLKNKVFLNLILVNFLDIIKSSYNGGVNYYSKNK